MFRSTFWHRPGFESDPMWASCKWVWVWVKIKSLKILIAKAKTIRVGLRIGYLQHHQYFFSPLSLSIYLSIHPSPCLKSLFLSLYLLKLLRKNTTCLDILYIPSIPHILWAYQAARFSPLFRVPCQVSSWLPRRLCSGSRRRKRSRGCIRPPRQSWYHCN